MLSWDESERLKRHTAELDRYGVHIAIVLSVVFSLMTIAILSKRGLLNHLPVDVAVLAGPMLIALYFRKRIVLFGVFTYIAAVGLALIAAVLFGV